VVSSSLARASLERMKRFGIRPNRELGQNFLVDDNVLDVIGREAELSSEDVVLEVGGGLGVLSEYLAEHVAHVHVIETDVRLEPALGEALSGHPNASVTIADVMKVDLPELDPAPEKVVANLPYGVAVPALMRTIEELEQVGLWCLMVQREIADRLVAQPGTKAYGIPSVLVQHSCLVDFERSVSRNVFQPRPNVDSALIRLRRTNSGFSPHMRSLVRAAFAHRRKTLLGSLRLTLGSKELESQLREELQALGYPVDVRGEQVTPFDFFRLSQRLKHWLL
jgi:16S rRNA (adenine1518-N6/adenine1519-N6)-dimethyltransferase